MTQSQVLKALLANPAVLAQLLTGAKPSKKAAKTKKQAKPARPTGDQFVGALIVAVKAQLGDNIDVQPRVNVLTYDKWVEAGRKVVPGQKSIVVAGRKTGLFHVTQTAAVEVAA